MSERYAKALQNIATEASDGLPEYTPQAMVSIAKQALKGQQAEIFDLRQSPQYHPGDLA
ncbi:hypothetical protein [Sphingobium chungbukense]|uniref:hypothetical protein n=1 Tax=Sphingobium chungbukense TaxID=56193 RepID=UPI0012EE442C|nr:hypothetical protein [Sphingobium chungbukense]